MSLIRSVLKPVDLLVALVLVPVIVVRLTLRALSRRPSPSTARRLLVIDSAYSLASIRDRGLERFVLERDLDGFFDHVFTFHPLVGADDTGPGDLDEGAFSGDRLADRHTMLQAHIGLYPALRALPISNFLLAQADALLRVDAIIRHEKVSLIRAHDPFYLGLLGWSVARMTRRPLVVFIQGNYDHLYESTGKLAYPRLLRTRQRELRLSRWILRHADLVAGGNQNNLEYGLSNGARPDRATLFRIGNAIEPYHFTEPDDRPRVQLEITPGAPYVVFVGRLEPLKHPDDVIRACAIARVEYPDLHCVLVGDGAMAPALADLARELGIEKAIHFVGNRPQTWIANVLPNAAAVAAPLVGRSLVEAALSGAPIVAYEIEWHAELIAHGETGLLVPYRDHHAMGEAFVRLLGDRHLAQGLGDRGREAALAMMDPVALVAHERHQYQRLLSSMTTLPSPQRPGAVSQ